MSLLIFWIYKWILSPPAWLVLQILRPLLRGKVREMIDDKNRGYRETKTSVPFTVAPLWIHASSGEVEYARPLIREFKQTHPDIPILVTYSSPSAKKILRQIPEIDAWTALPWDLPFSYRRFFREWKPRMLLVARTDLWPVMAQATFRAGIPAYMFSATFAANSSRLKGVSRFLTRYALNRLQKIFCVNEGDLQNLTGLRLRAPVEILGDTRFDQVLYRLEHPKPVTIKNRGSHFTFVMGSTWPEDEKVLIPAIARLATKPLQFILAPHEIHEDHLQELEQSLTSLGLRYVRYSRFTSWQSVDIVILDQIGVLAELYRLGDVAFVGGSFKRQVHSVMEPLAAGLPVLVGPHHHNNREALDFQKSKVAVPSGTVPLVQCVQNENEIIRAIEEIIRARAEEIKPQIIATVRNRTGVTRAVLEKISERL